MAQATPSGELADGQRELVALMAAGASQETASSSPGLHNQVNQDVRL